MAAPKYFVIVYCHKSSLLLPNSFYCIFLNSANHPDDPTFKHDPYLSISKASADHYFKNVENALDDSNSTHMAKYWDEPWKLLVEELNVIKTPEYGSLGYTKVKEINS